MEDLVISGDTLKKYYGKKETIFFPENLTAVENRAFKDNPYIKKVFLPKSVKAIWSKAFENCVNLKDINIPEGTYLVSDAFLGCKNLSKESWLQILHVCPKAWIESDMPKELENDKQFVAAACEVVLKALEKQNVAAKVSIWNSDKDTEDRNRTLIMQIGNRIHKHQSFEEFAQRHIGDVKERTK